MTKYQKHFRKAFWKDDTEEGHEVKRSFYNWGLQLYKAALYHAQPLPPNKYNNPVPIFHGAFICCTV